MRFSAIATDPLDFSRALRLELGLAPEIEVGDRSLVTATVVDGDMMLGLLEVASASGTPVVVMNIRVPFKFDGPAEMQVYEDVGGCVLTRLGATLWAGMDPAGPILLTDRNGANVSAFTADGIVPLPGLPLGLEASPDFGFERAMQRISDRFLAVGKMRDMMPMAA